MKADGIWGNIFQLERRKTSLAEILANIPLFNTLTPKELRVLEKVVHVRTYKPGDTVFVETEPGVGMYVVRSGRVNIVLQHRTDNRIVLAELEPGDFFGEMALMGDTARSATAVAVDDVELIGFFHPDLMEIINLHPQMGAKISFGLAKTLADRLRFTNTQLREIWDIRGHHEESVR